MNPIELATTDELLDELCKRFTYGVFLGQYAAQTQNDRSTYLGRHWGNVYAVIGLLHRQQASLTELEIMAALDEIHNEEEDDDD